MARLVSIAIVNVPHHVTQRENARQFLLALDSERLVYLQLLRRYVQLHELSLLGYCLMSNHVHLIVVPRRAESLALALKNAHGRYASYWNAAHQSSGHVWQGRFYSCPLDDAHLWIALALHRKKSGTGGFGERVGGLEVVERGRPLRDEGRGPLFRHGSLGQALSSAAWREYLGSSENDAELPRDS